MSTLNSLSGSRDASQVENLRSRFGYSWGQPAQPTPSSLSPNSALHPSDSTAQGMCDPVGPSSVDFGSWMSEGEASPQKKSRTGRKAKARKSRRSKRGSQARKGRKSRRGGRARRARASRRRRAA